MAVSEDVLNRSGNAISGIESGGNYGAVGSSTNGRRPYGKYQVMDFNIGPWSKEALGREVSVEEFLKSPEIQEAVFRHKFGQYIQQYGSPEAAAKVWFGGPGALNNPNAKDVLGTSVGGYGQKFMASFGGGQTPPQPTPPSPGPQMDPNQQQNAYLDLMNRLLQQQMSQQQQQQKPQQQQQPQQDWMKMFQSVNQEVKPVPMGNESPVFRPQGQIPSLVDLLFGDQQRYS